MRELIAIVATIVFIIIVFGLGGCAQYDIKRCDENGICSEAHIKSPRKFGTVDIQYDRETGSFRLKAGEVGTDTSAMEALANVILLQNRQISGEQ